VSQIPVSPVIIEKATELGKALVESEQFRQVREKQDKAFNNMVSLELLQKYEATKKAYAIKAEKGELTEAEIKGLEALELELHKNRLCRELLEARAAYQAMLNEVMTTILKVQKEAMDKIEP